MTDQLSRRQFLQWAGSEAVLPAFATSLLSNDPLGREQTSPLQGVPSLDGSLVHDDAALREAGRDAGGIVQRRARAVLKPGSVDDIVKMIRYANVHKLPVAMRGRGHARYGQALVEGGIVIDSRTLSAVGEVSNNTIEVEAGASLDSIVRSAFDAGFAFPVMTSCLMLSVGGFLSAGGQTRGSQRYGAFVDQVAQIDVVTGDGRLVTCSETRERELFDMILAGMGQCGIIVRARLKVILAPEQVSLRTLTYTSVEKFLRDQLQVALEARFDVIEGGLTRNGRQNWAYQLTVGDFGTAKTPLDPAARIRDLSPDTVSEPMGLSYRSYVLGGMPPRPAPRPASDPQPPRPAVVARRPIASPSLALWIPASTAHELLTTGLPPPTDRGITAIECTALDTRRFHRPLFRVPDEQCMMALWLLRVAFVDTGPSLDEQLAANRRVVERALAFGAKRYAPYSDVASPADWERHYGKELYQRFATAKRRFDPGQILTPGPRMFV